MKIELFNQQIFKEDNIQQNWYRIEVDEFLLEKKNTEPKPTNKRAVGITFPLNFDKNKKYDYVINLDFNIDGKSSDWYQWLKDNVIEGTTMYEGYGGYIPYNSKTKPWYENGQLTGFNYLMNLYKKLVNNDIVIIQLSMTESDSYYYANCTKEEQKDYKSNLCWNVNNNPDLNYLQNLFDIIKNEKFPIKLEYSNMGLIGYSVGAQALSRYINEFPFLKTIKHISFPKIKFAVLIGGGSYFCYPNDTSGPNFKNCINRNIGCCPDNIIEQNFHDGTLKWSDHPPVLLVQQSNDFFADPNASIFYFNIMSKNNAPVLRISDYSNTHGINSFDQSNKILNFILNIFDLEDKKSINKNIQHKKLNIINLVLLIIFAILFLINIYMIREINNNFYYLILLILVIFIVFLSINLYQTSDNFKIFGKPITNDILQNNRDKNKSYSSVINKEDIIKKINENGILITMNSTKLYCPEFEETLKKCDDSNCSKYVTNCPLGRTDVNCKCIDASQCTLFNINNIEELLNYNLTDAGTSCFACDTTYLNKNLPPQLFGPYLETENGSYNGLGESFPIGFLLDFDNLMKNGYIACGYAFDAGSIGRTPPEAVKDNIYSAATANKCINEALKITDEDLLAGKLYVGNKGKISKNNCPASVMAGCLNYDATYSPSNKIPNLNNLSSYVIQNCKDIPSEKCLTQYAFSDKSINPFYELNDKGFQNFKKHAEQIQSILGKQSRTTWDENKIKNFYDTFNPDTSFPDYWAYQIPSDIKIDNKSIGWDKDGYKETEIDLFIPQKKGTDIKIKCQPTEKFKKVWKESILGVFTNNICYQDVKYNNARNFNPPVNNHCCSNKFNNELVKKLVDKFNNDSKHKINGYIIETIKPGVRIESETNYYDYNKIITQIT